MKAMSAPPSKSVAAPGTVSAESPVRFVDRDASKDRNAEKFSPQHGAAIKLHHKLAGMR